MKIHIKLAALALIAGFAACKKDSKTTTTTEPTVTPTPTGNTGSLKLNFQHLVNTEALEFGKNYRNANGDTFKVSKFNYYISNIVLTKSDNTTFSETYSYHLVKHSVAGSNVITLNNVPLGNYTSVKFLLGVDSLRNTTGAETGDLDHTTASDMYWSWSSGYIFMKLEGTSPQSSTVDKSITFHIGGFSGANKTQRNFAFSTGTMVASVSATSSPTVMLKVNVNEIFQNPTKISFAIDNTKTNPGTGARIIADNYADMITFDTVNN